MQLLRLLTGLIVWYNLLHYDLISCAYGYEQTTLQLDGINYDFQVARSAAELEKGLMFKTSLGKYQGMMFLFNDQARPIFWMKNTPLSLDMIFINAEGQIVCLYANASPYSEIRISCPYPTPVVLEVGAGTIKHHHLSIGDYIKHAYIKRYSTE